MRKLLLVLSFVAIICACGWFWYTNKHAGVDSISKKLLPSNTPMLSPALQKMAPPVTKVLVNNYHVFQQFNNCGPAALSMTLSYYGIQVNQEVLGKALRPYQNPQGDNDDKSVTLQELAEKSKEYGLTPFRRPNGNIEIIKLLIANDLPVITRTWLHDDEDIGHYRVIKGYNETSIIQDDSMQGANLWYTYDEFNTIWGKFNYEYLVLVPKDKVEVVKSILQADANEHTAWERAVTHASNDLATNPDDIYTRFNLSVALFNIGLYQQSVDEYEKIQEVLPARTLWYQIEPILAYYKLKKYDKVFEITEKILNNQNRAYSELYVLRGNIYKERGQMELARHEYEQAVFYNKNLKSAQNALHSLL